MNKVVLGQYALGEYYLGMGDNLKAIEAFKNSTDHPDAWRQMGLAYADLEDLENSINAFSNAIKAGDAKSIPWLVDLLDSHLPDDPNLEPTRRMLEKGIVEKNIDIIFSVGNLKFIAGEVEEAINFWMD
jgi:tetratricopeptide (TPR) repeat protein